jgi:metal-dependent amidase/aminoacylase/carboxypeptidase family protein
VANTCQTYGANYKLKYQRGVLAVQNDPDLTRLVEICAKEALGVDQIQVLLEPSLGAEDFAMYLDHAPGMMFRLGVGHQNQPNYPLHHPQFSVDESAIITGVITLAYAAYQYWQK